jgi:hypothetical protein
MKGGRGEFILTWDESNCRLSQPQSGGLGGQSPMTSESKLEATPECRASHTCHDRLFKLFHCRDDLKSMK